MQTTVASNQVQQHRWIEVFLGVLVGAALATTLAWGVFTAASPSVVAPTGSTTRPFQEPGLVELRRGERMIGADGVPAGVDLLDPSLLEHRRGERSVR